MFNLVELRAALRTKQEEALSIIEKAQSEERILKEDEESTLSTIRSEIKELQSKVALAEEREALEADKARKDNVIFDKDRADRSFKSIGEFVQLMIFNPQDQRMQAYRSEIRTQNMTVGADGGFLVPDQFSQQLLTVNPDEAIVRPRALVFPDESDADFHIPALRYSGNNMYAGAAVNWLAEADPKPETDVDFKRVTLTPFEVAAHVLVSDKIMRNAPAIEQIVNTQLRGALIDAEENAFLTGAGGFQPTGIIGHPATIGVNRGAPLTVTYLDLAAMYAAFRGRRGVWIVGRDILPQLMVLQDANNNYIWQPSARDGSPGTLFGMPVSFSDHSPALGAQGDVVLADLSYYLIKDGIGITLAASPHVRFINNQTVIKGFKSVDGSPWLLGPLPTAVPTSPFVELV